MSLIELAEKYQTAHIVQLTKKKNSMYMYSHPLYINFVTLIMHFQLELVSQELTHLRSIPLVLQNP